MFRTPSTKNSPYLYRLLRLVFSTSNFWYVALRGDLLAALSGKADTSELLAVVKMRDDDFSRIPLSENPLIALFDRPSNHGNLGTILRTADAFGVPVLLTNGCADPYSEKTLRASMGAVLRTAPRYAALPEILRICKARGIRITATALSDSSTDLRQTRIENDLVVIGSEGQGICRELLEASDRQIIIPMQPRCESLNAAVAAAIVMWNMKF